MERLYELKSGDTFIVHDEYGTCKVGDKYEGLPATILEVIYYKKSFLKFWEPKVQWGYVVEWN